MSIVDIATTVGELVTEKPARARLFEKMGIDYCCGGKKPLVQACSEKGLDAATVAIMLDLGESTNSQRFTDVNSMTLTALADHIEATHHVYLRRELPRIEGLIAKVVNAHGANHPEVVEVSRIFHTMVDELTSHMAKEERILFPAIRAMESSGEPFHCGSLANPIRQMEAEHDAAGDALAAFHKLTGGYVAPSNVCNTYRAMLEALEDLEKDMHQHVHKENNVLFPRAIAMEISKA